jgi:hypothetical protein
LDKRLLGVAAGWLVPLVEESGRGPCGRETALPTTGHNRHDDACATISALSGHAAAYNLMSNFISLTAFREAMVGSG